MHACPACGEENPDKAKFCSECAAPLTEQPTTGAREERKVVSVLFCDLVGFTTSSEQADPEEVRARLAPFHACVKHELEGFGGTVEKFIGDAVMAVFGAPIAHEDDAERAVRAGLRILEAIEEMNEADDALGLSVRIAVNTGEALVTLGARPELGEAMVAGDVVNTASRLQGAAPIGSVVVGEVTHRATEPIFVWEELDPVALKGKAEPTPLWKVVDARGRFGVDIMRAPTTPFIGRDDDLGLLTSLYGRASRERSVQFITLVGEPGVGKSRLVSEFSRTLDDRPELITWRQGRCLPYGEGISFWALGEIVKAQAGILDSDGLEAAKQKLAVALEREGTDAPWIAQRLAPLIGAEAVTAADQTENFTAWRRFLESIASEGSAVIVIEDLHWADDAMVAYLEHVAEWSQGAPLLVMCTSRPEFFERHPDWGAGKRNSLTISLSPLTDEETARLVGRLLETVVLPAATQAAILDRAGGNPLYAEEFVRMLTDRGLIRRHGSTLTLAEDVEIPVPDTVQALIAARIDTLTPERKALLHDASVIGKVFWGGALAAMGERESAQVAQALHELANKELVRPARVSSIADQAEFAFWHALVRDVSYAQIPKTERAERHLAAARWIEAAGVERPRDVAEILIHHYDRAIELQGEQVLERVRDPLRRALIHAGDRARGTDLSRASRCFVRAIDLAEDEGERTAISRKLGNVFADAGDYPAAIARLKAAAAAARTAGDAVAEAAILATLSRPLSHEHGLTTESDAMLERAISILEFPGPSIDLMRAQLQMANVMWVRARNPEAMEWADKALHTASRLPRANADELSELTGMVLSYRGFARLLSGDEGGRLDADAGVEALQATGVVDVMILLNYAEALWPSVGPEAALRWLRDGAKAARRIGSRGGEASATRSVLGPLFDLGEWRTAVSAGRRAVSLETRTDESDAGLVVIYALQGKLQSASALVGNLAVMLRRVEEPQRRIWALSAIAIEAFLAGGAAEATEAIHALALTPGVRDDWYYVRRLPMMLRICIRADELALAESLLEGVRPVPLGHEHVLVSCRAILAEARGELDEAEATYSEAVKRWTSFPSVPERVRLARAWPVPVGTRSPRSRRRAP